MTDQSDLEGLRGLHQDLIAFSSSLLRNVDRLWAELDARVDEFRHLLDKPPRNEASRKKLLSGLITVDEEEYSINQEFQESATQIADALEIDELAAAQLLLEAQEDSEIFDRSMVASAVIRFHERRSFLLECLRLVLTLNDDLECGEEVRGQCREFTGLILEIKDGPARNGSLNTQRCLSSMGDIERWLQALGERLQGAKALGQTLSPEYDEMMGFQQTSLRHQHESLGAIINLLIKSNYSKVEDFYTLLEILPNLDKWDYLAVHYVPITTAFTSQYGSPEGSGSLRDARLLNSKILDGRDRKPWNLLNLQAATIVLWLAEYSGWYLEQPVGSPVQGVDFEAEAHGRSECLFAALKDGALQCILSICSQITPEEWYEPVKSTLISFLLRDTQPLPNDLASTSVYFRNIIMEQIETFADAFITNMPDTLRRFKSEEDDQRRRYLSGREQTGGSEQEFHLERFLIIISFALDKRADAAEAFWSDVDSNLYGFLQWASKRQSTPCVAAFCEMLRSISQREECAGSAHQFLLEEFSTTPAKIRRSTSLSWSQIFEEINLYILKIREQPLPARTTNFYPGKPIPDDIDEPESAIMLESYLRLMSHICTQSTPARSWILTNSNFHLLDKLFYLCNTTVPSRLQARAFTVIRALLTDKSTEVASTIWISIDDWVSGGFSAPLNAPRNSKASNGSTWAGDAIFAAIAGDIEQSNEFIALLQNLVCPASQNSGLNDHLPFPETLGSTYRMSGIEPYVDFVLDKVFAPQATQLEDYLQTRILTWNILNFVVSCLDTFNEDLVILANRSGISVDNAMNTSSLLAYVRLHPFCRVMDWMFNESVLVALFASAHKDIEEVSSASPDSPLILSLLRSIDTMNLVMDLQSTYLDIVRPLIKTQSAGRRQPVFSPSLASFEDSVALNLDLIVDLGLYAGIGNENLTISSLKLLEKLASSRKLNIQSTAGLASRQNGNRLIAVVEQHNEAERIARSLSLAMQFDPRELERGSESPGWVIKLVILDFLIHCLSASPERPTLAHVLLGFACTGSTLDIEADGLFFQRLSLFHVILQLVVEYPDGEGGSMQSWSLSVKQKGMQVLSILWTSPLSSVFTLTELRASEFFFALFLRQLPILPHSEWDGRSIMDPQFMSSESAEAIEQYLWQRCSLLEYACIELRVVSVEAVPSLKVRIFSTLLGSTSLPDGEQAPNLTIFDLLDFIELNITNDISVPQLNLFAGLDFNISTVESSEGTGGLHDMRSIQEMILLRLNELRKTGRLPDANSELLADAEVQHILPYYQSQNSRYRLQTARLNTMKAWAELLILAIDTCELDPLGKAALTLQALQIISPKLESYVSFNAPGAIIFAKLVQALLFQLDFKSSTLDRSRAGDVANDRLFQIFRVGLQAVNSPGLNMQLREVLYNICYRYLAGMAEVSDAPVRSRHGIHTVKATGEKTIDIICDDAYSASATCRLSALLLLHALERLAKNESSNYITDSLVRTNFVKILVESIERIPMELRETTSNDVPLLLTYYEGKFALLLTISQSKSGALHIVNAGLFQAMRVSGLFSVDPDIGVEIDNPEALSKYYKLLLAVTRVITAAVLSQGPRHDQTIESARMFLVENRALVVAIFKRQARIGGISFDNAGVDIEELVELFVLLISMTEFLDYEAQRDAQSSRKLVFT